MNSEKQSTNLQMTLREVNRVGEGKKNVPKLRFKGYEDAWEQRKLGDIAISFSGGTPKVGESSFYGGDIPFIRSGEIGSYRTELTLSLEGLNNSSASLVNQGDILYALYGATSGEVEISKINGAINQAILAIKPHDDFNSYTIVQWLKKEKENIISTYLQGGQGNLSGAIIKNLDLVLPSKKEEQELIGKYFKMIDNLITLHQRKYDALKKMKKTLLSKMFPKDGEDVPEIRFKGFTDAWEQRKLGQVLDFSLKTNSLSRSMLNYEEGELKNIHYGDILMDYGPILNFKTDTIPYITEGKVEEFTSQLLMNGDVVFADAAEDESVGKAIEINGLEEQCLVSGLHTIVGRPTIKFAERFLGYYINSNSYHNQLLPLMQGTKVSSISKNTLKKTMIIYPKVSSEQLRIGSFFYCLESIITLHQRKLEELKNMKKTLLQQMFV